MHSRLKAIRDSLSELWAYQKGKVLTLGTLMLVLVIVACVQFGGKAPKKVAGETSQDASQKKAKSAVTPDKPADSDKENEDQGPPPDPPHMSKIATTLKRDPFEDLWQPAKPLVKTHDPKRDPGQKPDDPAGTILPRMAQLHVTGIIINDNGPNEALINRNQVSRYVKEGQSIAGFILSRVYEDRVVLIDKATRTPKVKHMD